MTAAYFQAAYPEVNVFDAGNNKESFATDPGLLNDVIRQLTEVVVTQTVEVRLLGLDGDTGSLLQISEASLLKHLKALRADMDTVALDPYPQLMVGSGWHMAHMPASS